MALVNIKTVFVELMYHLKRCPLGGGLEIMSYKRNRTIAIVKENPDVARILQKGYVEKEWCVPFGDLEKQLRKPIKKEFPRSRKVRLFKFDDPEELNRLHQKI